jgi:hypothetical protein
MSVDAANNLYVVYSGVTWKDPNPEGINYRHLFGRARFHDHANWSTEPIDLNDGIMYYGQEYVFASMAKRIANDKLRMIYQTSDQPGTAVGTSGTTGAIPYHDNIIQYREVPGSTFWTTGTGKNELAHTNQVSQNYPNPVKGTTSFNVDLGEAAKVSVEVCNIMGQKIMQADKGVMNAGTHRITLDGNLLKPGICFYTVKINGESYTHKMIVE